MCIFAAPASVQLTRLFASRRGARQALVYELALDTPSPNAMMLPVPVAAPGAPIELLDLSYYPRFFDDLHFYYVPPPRDAFGAPGFAPQATLEVVRVGSYDASIVPALGDLGRLDDRFRLAPSLAETLAARYADHAFVVYQFAAGKQRPHPFGFFFESRYPDQLFFPTVHVHDGAGAPPTARFAHRFYAQGAKLDERYPLRWEGGTTPDVPGVLDRALPLDYAERFGDHPNVDLLAPAA